MLTNDIPIEGILKYIKKDRDKCREKLEAITPYARELERKVRALEEALDKKNEEYDDLLGRFADNEVKRADYNQAMHDNAFMRRALEAFRLDYRKTEWFKQLEAQRKKWFADRKKLREIIEIKYDAETVKKAYPDTGLQED